MESSNKVTPMRKSKQKYYNPSLEEDTQFTTAPTRKGRTKRKHYRRNNRTTATNGTESI